MTTPDNTEIPLKNYENLQYTDDQSIVDDDVQTTRDSDIMNNVLEKHKKKRIGRLKKSQEVLLRDNIYGSLSEMHYELRYSRELWFKVSKALQIVFIDDKSQYHIEEENHVIDELCELIRMTTSIRDMLIGKKSDLLGGTDTPDFSDDSDNDSDNYGSIDGSMDVREEDPKEKLKEVISYYDNGNKKYHGFVSTDGDKNPKQGKWLFWDNDGVLLSELTFKDNYRHGLCIQHFRSFPDLKSYSYYYEGIIGASHHPLQPQTFIEDPEFSRL